jgi:hypothetical protein
MSSRIQCINGAYFDYLNPTAAMIDIVEIAEVLSRVHRFAGHTLVPYTVAQHSVHVAHAVPTRLALWGLLHDAAEAYMGDLPRPLKRLLPEFSRIEAGVMAAVCTKFGLPLQEPPQVKFMDNVLLVTEKRDLLPVHPDDDEEWGGLRLQYGPLMEPITPWLRGVARNRFLACFEWAQRMSQHE